jgi:sarcosine oxidase subunit beta
MTTSSSLVGNLDRIVVIGGGVVGMSIAYHLASSGYSNVIVLERDELGSGSTSKATGGIRQQFSSIVNALLSREAVAYFKHFEYLVGEPFKFRQHGYLFVTSAPDLFETARAGAELQQQLGIGAMVVTPEEIGELHRGARTDDLVGGTYCPTDGSGSPADVVQAFARQARRRGAQIRQHVTVLGIECDNSRHVRRVMTTAGPIDAAIVINAAGPWAGLVAEMVGVSIPLIPRPRQAFALAPADYVSGDMPFTVDLDSGAYLHPEDTGGVIGGTDRDQGSSFEAKIDESRLERLIDAITWRFPSLSEARIMRGWAGLREMTPDDHAMVGPVAAVPGFWLAAGFSGHGFMHSPIVGRELSRWLLTGSTTLDLSPLDPARFASGEFTPEGLVF